jgi:hypothetical protein
MKMAVPLIILFTIGVPILVGSAWYWRIGDVKSAKKLFNAAIACWMLLLLFLTVALTASNPNVWWGSGCNLGMAVRGLCLWKH